ncbi:sulfate/molybdate ABC transporter ATP-binding protein [Ferrovibrio sp.]|jgi:sulfate transport system ATP-binding protein|uniref:sulfate/molybdate ABC transporter ATP-binding protein n=1 Tax=Ferrovibrio sp. TaxID=1917215 RepID=UPI0035B0C370
MRIDVVSVSRQFGEFQALRSVDLTVQSGELVALLGPSGSGKTTLLRVIAGLDWPDAGDIRFDGASTGGRPAGERQVGFVFQHYALFRHMTVFENVAFGLRVRPRKERPSEAEIRRRVDELLRLVQIDWLADRMPAQLSGGQRQRVALARALAIEPNVLLLDEPFGALDAKVRKELRRWLRRLHEQLGMTSVFVTHDQEEALELADRVVVMNKGRIEQIDTPARLYDNPATPFVSSFLGDNNALDCHVAAGSVLVPGIDTAALERVDLPNGKAKLYVRPHDIAISADPDGEARVRFVSAVGAFVRIEAELPDGRIVELTRTREEQAEEPLALDARVGLRLYRAQVFPGS